MSDTAVANRRQLLEGEKGVGWGVGGSDRLHGMYASASLIRLLVEGMEGDITRPEVCSVLLEILIHGRDVQGYVLLCIHSCAMQRRQATNIC